MAKLDNAQRCEETMCYSTKGSGTDLSRRISTIIRRRVAPPRFVLFAAILVVLLVLALSSGIPFQIALLGSFDLATLAFLASLFPLFQSDPAKMRSSSAANDANRAGLLTITILILLVVLMAVGTLIADRGELSSEVPLILGSLVLAWIFANTIFGLHYAHLFYQDADGKDKGGLAFPKLSTPRYWDFFYFSFTLGMTFQTSDVVIEGPHMRRVVLAHTTAAFLFNIGVLAFAINTVGSL